MPHPVGYYVNRTSRATDAFVDRYGPHLEKLDRLAQLAAFAILARTAYLVSRVNDDSSWSIEEELDCGYTTLDTDLQRHLIAFDNETVDEALALCEALIVQLRHGGRSS